MSRHLVCCVVTLLLACVNRVFCVAVVVHVCHLSRWQPLGPWAAACWWTSIAPAESCKPPVRPAALDPSPARMQPENRHIHLQHCSSACGKRYLRTAGCSYRELKLKRGTLGTASSNMTQTLMHFMEQHRGGLCASVPAFPFPGVLGSQNASPSRAVAGTAATRCVDVISQTRGKGAGNWPSVLPFGSCPGPVTLETSKEGYLGQSEWSAKIRKKKAGFNNSKLCAPICLRRSSIALQSEPLKIVCVLKPS